MSEFNSAVILSGIVAAIAVRYVATSPATLRRAAALLIRRAAGVEAAEAARRQKGDSAYRLACEYLDIEAPPKPGPNAAGGPSMMPEAEHE